MKKINRKKATKIANLCLCPEPDGILLGYNLAVEKCNNKMKLKNLICRIENLENEIGLKNEIGSKMYGGLLVNKEQKLIVSEIDLGCVDWETAKKLCTDYRGGGFDDWRLPTKDELNQIYSLHRMSVCEFVATYYWSSSETSSTNSWKQGFFSGYQSNANKYDSNYVRAVRGF